ncbi:MAG: nickel/cobalt transporter [Pseudomonadota bacterium]
MKTLEATMLNAPLRAISKLALAGLFIFVVFSIYAYWNHLVVATVQWQQALHAMLASHINAISNNPLQHGGALIALSFGYGVFHAIGPGHGKAVILTYLGTHKEGLSRGVMISLAAALLQSLIAILLVTVLARVLSFKLAQIHTYGNEVALASYVLVIALGALLLLRAVLQIIKLHRAQKHSHHHHSADENSHSHTDHCGCSHAHAPDENQSIWQSLSVVLSMGIRPCSGAIVVLIYAHLVGVYSYGIVATLLMGLGTGLTVSLVAVCTLYARSWLEGFASEFHETGSHVLHSGTHYVRCLGGILLIALGWSFFSAAVAVSSSHPLF